MGRIIFIIFSSFFPALIKILSLPSEALIFAHFHLSFKTKENHARVFSQFVSAFKVDCERRRISGGRFSGHVRNCCRHLGCHAMD